MPLGALSLSANYGVLWYVLCLVPWLFGAADPLWKALYVAAPVTLVEMTGFVIKHFVGRARPPVADPTQPEPDPAAAQQVVPLVAREHGRGRHVHAGQRSTRVDPVAPRLVLVLCFSRVYLGVHYLGDVLGGLAYGLVFGAAWVLLVSAPV